MAGRLQIVTVLRHEGKEFTSAPATVVMGSPWQATLWVANSLIARGMALKPGEVAFTGAVGQAFVHGKDGPARGTFRGSFGPLGEITCLAR